jgi:hypothetical protein
VTSLQYFTKHQTAGGQVGKQTQARQGSPTSSKSIYKLFILSLCTECFQAGACKGSAFIIGEQKYDEFECLDFCKSGSFVDISKLSLANFT